MQNKHPLHGPRCTGILPRHHPSHNCKAQDRNPGRNPSVVMSVASTTNLRLPPLFPGNHCAELVCTAFGGTAAPLWRDSLAGVD